MLKRNNIKSVICLNDNNIFNSIADASRYYECSGAEICNSCINEGYYSVYGNRFLYYETYLTKTEYPWSKSLCFTQLKSPTFSTSKKPQFL